MYLPIPTYLPNYTYHLPTDLPIYLPTHLSTQPHSLTHSPHSLTSPHPPIHQSIHPSTHPHPSPTHSLTHPPRRGRCYLLKIPLNRSVLGEVWKIKVQDLLPRKKHQFCPICKLHCIMVILDNFLDFVDFFSIFFLHFFRLAFFFLGCDRTAYPPFCCLPKITLNQY